nr:zinc finger, CCHC-type [Tanacetum cinerariifolium]
MPKPRANKKVKGKGKADKNKQVVPYQPKPKPNPLKRKENPNKDQACHHCHVVEHWKRNCPFYLEELRANKKKSDQCCSFSVISVNGVFEIDMNNNVSKNNNNSIFSINKKRKLDLNSSYLWHCRLAHIGKTRMQKLHSE